MPFMRAPNCATGPLGEPKTSIVTRLQRRTPSVRRTAFAPRLDSRAVSRRGIARGRSRVPAGKLPRHTRGNPAIAPNTVANNPLLFGRGNRARRIDRWRDGELADDSGGRRRRLMSNCEMRGGTEQACAADAREDQEQPGIDHRENLIGLSDRRGGA